MRPGHILINRSGVFLTLSNPGSRCESRRAFISECGNVRGRVGRGWWALPAHKGRQGAMRALWLHLCMEAATVARILAYYVGSPFQPSWSSLVLDSMSSFHTTMNGKRAQPGMNRDLVRTLFSPWDGLRHQQGTSEWSQMAQEFGEDVYFTQYLLMKWLLTHEMIAF